MAEDSQGCCSCYSQQLTSPIWWAGVRQTNASQSSKQEQKQLLTLPALVQVGNLTTSDPSGYWGRPEEYTAARCCLALASGVQKLMTVACIGFARPSVL